MGEIIASLGGYFYSPGHNFDWKHAGVSRVIPQRARSQGNGGEGVRQESPALAITTAPTGFAAQTLATTVKRFGAVS